MAKKTAFELDFTYWGDILRNVNDAGWSSGSSSGS